MDSQSKDKIDVRPSHICFENSYSLALESFNLFNGNELTLKEMAKLTGTKQQKYTGKYA